MSCQNINVIFSSVISEYFLTKVSLQFPLEAPHCTSKMYSWQKKTRNLLSQPLLEAQIDQQNSRQRQYQIRWWQLQESFIVLTSVAVACGVTTDGHHPRDPHRNRLSLDWARGLGPVHHQSCPGRWTGRRRPSTCPWTAFGRSWRSFQRWLALSRVVALLSLASLLRVVWFPGVEGKYIC